MYFLIYCLFILFNTSSISTLSWYFNTKCRLFFRLNIVLFRGSHSLKFFPGRFGHLFPFQMIGRRFLHMSCQPVGFRKTSHSLLTVIINDFPSGLSKRQKSSSIIFLNDPDQCLCLILAGWFLSRPSRR